MLNLYQAISSRKTLIYVLEDTNTKLFSRPTSLSRVIHEPCSVKLNDSDITKFGWTLFLTFPEPNRNGFFTHYPELVI